MKKVKLLYSICLILILSCHYSNKIPRRNIIKIACIGDSITEGYGVEMEDSYPSKLQNLLPEKYEVRNYGVSGVTLLKDGDKPYWNEKRYNDALDWGADIVIISLGTNDSKPINWENKAHYVRDYLGLIQSFRKKSPNAEIFICKMTPAFSSNFDISNANVKTLLPLIDSIANKAHVSIIDFNTQFTTKSQLFSDGVHPNESGANLLANIISKRILAN